MQCGPPKVCVELLTKGLVNVDSQFNILFKEQADARDARPMTYPGRILLPAHIEPHKCIWKNTNLFKNKRTAEVTLYQFLDSMYPQRPNKCFGN